MKKLLLAFLLLSGKAFAQEENGHEVLLGGDVYFRHGQVQGFSEGKGYALELDPLLGCTIWKGFAAGMELSAGKSHVTEAANEDNELAWGIGPFVRYEFRFANNHAINFTFSYLSGKVTNDACREIVDANDVCIGTDYFKAKGSYSQFSPGVAWSYFLAPHVCFELGYFYNARKEKQDVSQQDVYLNGSSSGAGFNLESSRSFGEVRGGFLVFLPLGKR